MPSSQFWISICLLPNLGPVIPHYCIISSWHLGRLFFKFRFLSCIQQRVGPTYLVYDYQKPVKKSAETTILEDASDLLMLPIFPYPQFHPHSPDRSMLLKQHCHQVISLLRKKKKKSLVTLTVWWFYTMSTKLSWDFPGFPLFYDPGSVLTNIDILDAFGR